MAEKIEITEDSVIADVLRHYPECIDVFDKYNMPCRTCMGVSEDTVHGGAVMHNVDADTLLSELKMCCVESDRKDQGK